jgi:hypothetical protein
VAIDVVTTIIRKSKSVDPDGNLVCMWNPSRGINGSIGVWRRGVTAFDELGVATILG